MRVLDCDEWRTLGQLYAVFGNSLLSPMNRTETVGLDPAFWHDLAGLLGGAIARPAQDCAAWAERAAGDCSRDELVQRVSVEFTHLFFPPGTVSQNDFFAESVGSLIGLILAARYSDWFKSLLHAVLGKPGWLALRLVEAYLAGYVFFSLFPFDILRTRGELDQKMLE